MAAVKAGAKIYANNKSESEASGLSPNYEKDYKMRRKVEETEEGNASRKKKRMRIPPNDSLKKFERFVIWCDNVGKTARIL